MSAQLRDKWKQRVAEYQSKVKMGCGSSKKLTQTGLIARSTLEEQPGNNDFKILPSTFVRANENRFVHVYKMGANLGSGHTGDVSRCVHRDSKEERAVKIFRRNTLSETTVHGTRRSQEVEILRIVDHPNIVRVYEYFEDPKRIFLVMEYCRGGELQQRINSKYQFSEDNAAMIAKQVFMVASYLHDKSIIHRDLKPENIVLEESDGTLNIKIIDFGAATFYSKKKLMRGAQGTIYYTAPEVHEGNYDEKCDVWSCGVITYVLLCGKLPFEGTTDEQVMERIKAMRYSVTGGVWNSISREAVDLLAAVFQPASARISAKEAIQHPWFQKFGQKTNLRQHAVSDTLDQIRSFHTSTKLKDAVLTYIATQSLTAQDTKELREVFNKIDANGDGRISKEELMAQYTEIMEAGEAREIVDAVMKEVDTDGSGFMDYTEFLKASIDQKKLLSMKNLEKAFSLFDKDGSGTISTAEIRKVLASGSEVDESVWSHILHEVDENGDGEIDVKEFEAILQAKF